MVILTLPHCHLNDPRLFRAAPCAGRYRPRRIPRLYINHLKSYPPVTALQLAQLPPVFLILRGFMPSTGVSRSYDAALEIRYQNNADSAVCRRLCLYPAQLSPYHARMVKTCSSLPLTDPKTGNHVSPVSEESRRALIDIGATSCREVPAARIS